MAKIVLVHGYGTGLSPLKSSKTDHHGFSGFEKGILSKDVAVFSWHQEENSSLLKFINPYFHYKTYEKERSAAQSTELLKGFKKFIEKEKPDIVVCHSLGAYLFLNYLKQYEEVSSIKKAVFVQADLKNNKPFPANPNHIEFTNVYCPWDPALLTSKVMHGYTPAGLTGWKQPQVRNKFIPLFGHWNLHISTIAQKQFAEFVSSL